MANLRKQIDELASKVRSLRDQDRPNRGQF
jgi:hypothetical protein